MIDPELKDKEGLPLTCRAVFIIGACPSLQTCINCCASRHSCLFIDRTAPLL